jgi:Predicted acetyltransferase
MEFVWTDGKDGDFHTLCGMLDDFLNDAVGGEMQRAQYNQYNALENIHDVILVYDGQLAVACAGFKFYGAGIAEVKRVFVRADYRGKGLSKQLMRALEERAEEKGYSCLILETGRPLTAAVGLYQSIGYRVIDNYGPYKSLPVSVCMKKHLAAHTAAGTGENYSISKKEREK